MRRQLVLGLVVRLTVIKAKTRPGIEAKANLDIELCSFVRHIRAVDRGAAAPPPWHSRSAKITNLHMPND